MTVTVLAEGIPGFLRFIQSIPADAKRAARLAINSVAKKGGRRALIRQMESEVAFPAGYIDEKRLELEQEATDDRLEAIITGRKAPTSLARFATNAVLGSRQASISVRVGPNASKAIPRAFLVRLRQGKQLTEDRFNVGLAIRVSEGDGVKGRRTQKAGLRPNVFLLYGPSVDQVFRSVAVDQADNISAMVATEFYRHLDRRVSGGGL